jgi:hypothetical protein
MWKVWRSSLMLTSPHQMSGLVFGSSTMRLSSGLRPVLAPDSATRAPDEVIADPFSWRRAIS